MDYTICSRTVDRDYFWVVDQTSPLLAKNARGTFAPAFEGSRTMSRFAALLRVTDLMHSVVLCVSVSTTRKDFIGAPIRTMAFLRAETPGETDLLAAFFAECLRKPDAETLYDAKSEIAKAVESLYQTKKPDDFLRFCRSLPAANGSGEKPRRREIRREDVASRRAMAESLPALIRGGEPFLIALTDRLPTDVLASLGTMFDKAVVRIFSKATSEAKPIPGPHAEGGPSPRVRAAAIGGAVILAVILLVAAGRSCRKAGGGDEAGGGTNIVSHAIGGGEAPTSPVPHGGQGGETAGETQRDDSTTNAASTEADAMEVGKPSTPFDNLDKEKQHD